MGDGSHPLRQGVTSRSLLLFRIDDADEADKHLFERGLGSGFSDSRPYRFFFGASPGFRAWGGGEESDGIESSDVSSGS